jgi:hypothetical protein
MCIIPRSFNDITYSRFSSSSKIVVFTPGGSCSNLVSADFVIKIGLMTRAHTHPYYIQWLNNSGKAKVTNTACVYFSIGTYHDYTDCDVVPM